MGCYCVKLKDIPLDLMIDSKYPEMDNQDFSQISSNNHILSKNSAAPKSINSINSDFNMGNITNTFNQPNINDSMEFKKSSFLKILEREKSQNDSFKEEKDFNKNLFDLINKARKDPTILLEKINTFMENIKVDINNNRSYYLINKKTKINLSKGREAFLGCIDFLNNLANKINNNIVILNQLEFKEGLQIPFPVDNLESCNNKEYITSSILNINKTITQNKMRIYGFHYDLSTNNPETSLILQVVDDNNSNGKRRNLIFDDKIKYVGINHGKVKDEIYCSYLLFAS